MLDAWAFNSETALAAAGGALRPMTRATFPGSALTAQTFALESDQASYPHWV